MLINIAIDGPSAAGKSTIAKGLAKKLGYKHLDTGAMYRCTAYKSLNNNIDLKDSEAIVKMLSNTNIDFDSKGNVYLDGKDVSSDIRTDEISMAASTVSTLADVRAELVRRQQAIASNKGYIMDGRDIGTVVLPNAEVKVFMTASAKARAMRRYKENVEKGIAVSSIEELTEEIAKRDEQDTNRSASPLRKAEDAIAIDTSDMSIEEVINAVYELAKPYLKEEAL